MDLAVPLVEPEAGEKPSPEPPPPLIIKADELDAAGTDVSTPITPALVVPPHPPQSASPQPMHSAQHTMPTRPILRRESSTPAPPAQRPPSIPEERAAEGAENQLPTDSLSLQQLRRLVTDMPKLEPQAYAYKHTDTRSFPEEIEEWFPYSEEERYMLLRGKEAFETRLERWALNGQRWLDVTDRERDDFARVVSEEMEQEDDEVEAVECLGYLAMGCWGDTAGTEKEAAEDGESAQLEKEAWGRIPAEQYQKSRVQIEWIRRGCQSLVKSGSVQKLFNVLRKACDNEQEADSPVDSAPLSEEDVASARLSRFIEINQSLTALYVVVEVGRWGNSSEMPLIRQAIADLEPNLLSYLTRLIASMRWEDSPQLPVARVLLLYWKTILFLFGSSEDLAESKSKLRTESDQAKGDNAEGIITTTPLDYHLFRQEITSKYPAYDPPPPLVPIEPENNSILPPLPNHPSRRMSHENLNITAGPNINGTSGSIFNQPVHIATPAPSPPPSPAGPGGKGGKKQNYQTNQNFPFLYPPLDETSNLIGGNSKTGLQDQLVGKRWEGSDVPASILEAGQLFASRMRMSRSIRQLWDVRERFIKNERGWDESSKASAKEGPNVSDESTFEEDEVAEADGRETTSGAAFMDRDPVPLAKPRLKAKHPMKETEDDEIQRRLDAIEQFYCDALPQLQSIVLVLWRIVFSNVSALVSQSSTQTGLPNGISPPDDNPERSPVRRRVNPSSIAQDGGQNETDEGSDPAVEELNAIRLREITSKAVSGILLMVLKWFRISHVLKFEYLTQLLLDANYLPLMLKLFAHQDVDRAVDTINDRFDLSFFHFCHVNSSHPPPPSSSDSLDAAAPPPPVPTHRRSRSPISSPPQSPPLKPSVNELGHPISELPSEPLTNYSPRFFFTTITLLRLMQKITKNHAHRSLLLVQYKSSTILRRHLKVPSQELRLYTLKLFKHQVPFCGRKWRQGNMRTITAVYLHVGMGLRDEWLAGGDIDAVVEEAVPVERAWRGLVGWWHLKYYRAESEGRKIAHSKGSQSDLDIMLGSEEEEDDGDAGEKGRRSLARGHRKTQMDEDEEDMNNFFARELEKMGWGVGSAAGDSDEESGGEEPRPGVSEWDGGPLSLEGWA